MTEPEKLEVLAYVFDLLHDAAERHESDSLDPATCSYCGNNECTLERPYCDPQKARRARRELDRLLRPPMESLQPERLRNPAERIYHEVWQASNEPHPAINHGFTTLEWVLCQPGQRFPDVVSHRDAQVATSIIQWLGTNGGRCLIDKAERLIEKERAVRNDLDGTAMNRLEQEADEPNPKLDEWARVIAGRAKPVTHFDYAPLEKVIKLALYRAYKAGARQAENFVVGTA